jgi:hypothetical protein
MVSIALPENYTPLQSEIYRLHPGETMSIGAVGGVLSNDFGLTTGTEIDYFTGLFSSGEREPIWNSTGQEFVQGTFSLGSSGEFTYTADPERDWYFYEIFHYWIHTDQGDFVGMLGFIVGDDIYASDQTLHIALHKADFAATSAIVGDAKVDTLLLNHLPREAQGRIDWVRDGDVVTLTLGGATIVAEGMERLQFSTGTLAFDVDGHAGQAYRLYKAALAREPDAGGLKFWIGELDRGTELIGAAARIIGSEEFVDLYGETPAAMIDGFYANILGREPQAFELDYWSHELASQSRSMADILVAFSESEENASAVAPVFADGLWII